MLDNKISQEENKDNASNNFNELKSLMAEVGLPFPEDKDIILDDSVHRYSSRPNGEEDEWYLGSEVAPGVFTCTFASWRQGENHFWTSSNFVKTDPELVRKYEEAKEKALTFELEKREEGRARAKRLWDNGVVCHRHPYLDRKKLPCRGLKMSSGALIIPLYDIDGKLGAVQLISTHGDKKFPGMPMKGYFHVIGGLQNAKEAYVAEGYATALSVHLATKKPCIAAFSSSLVCVIGKTIQNLYPEIKLVLAADNGGAGKKAADDWKEYISPHAAFPKEHSDFNDVWVEGGQEETEKQLAVYEPLGCAGRDIVSFLSQKLPPVIQINPFLAKGTFNIIYGGPGRGKSRIAYQLAFCLATKTKFLDTYETYSIQKVLYVDGELPPSQVQARFKAVLELCEKESLDPSNLTIFDKEYMRTELGEDLNLYDDTHLQRLLPALEKFDVIIFDNFNSMHIGPEGDSYKPDKAKWKRMFSKLYELKQKAIVMIMLMHTNKNDRLEGVQQILNDTDVALKLERPTDVDPSALLHFNLVYEKARDIPAYLQISKRITADDRGWHISDLKQANKNKY